MFGGARAVIGLDIGSSAIKAVQLRGFGKRHRVVAYGSEPLPRQAVVDGVVSDRPRVAQAIERLIGPATHFSAKQVCASLAGSAVIVKRICVPVTNDGTLSDAIHDEAARHIPFDIEDINLDFHILEGGPAGDSPLTKEVVVAAAKKERADDWVGLIAAAGRSTAILDVGAFALQHAFEANYTCDPGSLVVLLNVGASLLTINVLRGAESVFVRDISIGGNAFTEALQKEFGLPYEAAEQLKQGGNIAGVTFEDARPILHAVTETVLFAIQQTLDFFWQGSSLKQCNLIMLTGGASRLDGFRQVLQQRFNTPVEDLDPFRNVRWNTSRPGESAADFSSTGAVAMGLALRRAGDR